MPPPDGWVYPQNVHIRDQVRALLCDVFPAELTVKDMCERLASETCVPAYQTVYAYLRSLERIGYARRYRDRTRTMFAATRVMVADRDGWMMPPLRVARSRNAPRKDSA